MTSAQRPRALARVARGAFALCCALGSVACGRSGQAGAYPEPIDRTSPTGPAWSSEGVTGPEPELTDADVEQIAERVPRDRVPAVSPRSPSKGPANAPVTLQIFSDFQCSFCVRAAPTLAALEQRYRGRVRLVWRNYPLPSHDRARPAARAALEAFAEGGGQKFWALHDWLFSPQADLSDAGLRQAAERLALDASRVAAAVRSNVRDAPIDADIAAGDAAGIEGTPAVFINDYYVMGARHENEYAVVVERALRDSATSR